MIISSRKAKKSIADNYDLIEDLKTSITEDKNKMEKNMIYQQIENRKTVIKHLEKFVK